MKPLLFGLAVVVYLLSLYSSVDAQQPDIGLIEGFNPSFGFPLIQNGTQFVPTPKRYPLVPDFFTNDATKFKLNDSPQQCKSFCKRRSVRTWSKADWALYGQLWTETNKRGYWYDIQSMHALDCNHLVDNICAFHFGKMFLPWHRFYISHVEQWFQTLDHEINPGRALKEGEFCLGYWDYGYQEPFNNNLQDPVYNYVFNGDAMGSWNGSVTPFNVTPTQWWQIPDGYYHDLRIPITGNPFNWTWRAATLGDNQWNNPTIANCLTIANVEDNGDASGGFRPCVELSYHQAIHTAVGGIMGNLQWSAGDAIFFLHHCFIDYNWWLWQHNSASFYPTSPPELVWNQQTSLPYEQWDSDTAKDYNRFCFTYQPDGAVSQKSNYTGSGAPGSYGQLGSSYQAAYSKALSDGKPSIQDKGAWGKFIQAHWNGPDQFDALYNSYAKGVQKAVHNYNNLTSYYHDSYTQTTGTPNTQQPVANTQAASLQASNPTPGGSPAGPINKEMVTSYLNAVTGMSY